MNLFSLFLTSFLLVVFVKEAAFLKCYVCDSTKDEGCENPDERYVQYCGPEAESTTIETATEYPSTTIDSESSSSDNPTSISTTETSDSGSTTDSSSSDTNTELSSTETTDSESANDSSSSDTTTTINPTENTDLESSSDSIASDSTTESSPTETTDSVMTSDSIASDTTTESSPTETTVSVMTTDSIASDTTSESKSSFSDTTAESSDSTITRESLISSPTSDTTLVEESTSESALESSSTDNIDTTTISAEKKSLQRKRRSLVAQAADQLIRNYRLIDRNGVANSDSYACYTFTDQGKTSIRRGCVAIPEQEDGCAAVRDKLEITDSSQGDCFVCLMDLCNSGTTISKMSIVVISFVMIAKLIL